jgi:hypothetical protein
MAYDSYTKLLIHFNGDDEATTYTAETGQTVTFAGNAQIDTSEKKFGSGSALLDGSGDRLSVPDSDDWAFGDGNFTIDFWINFTSLVAYKQLFTQWTDGDANNRMIAYINSAGGEFKFCTGGVWSTNLVFDGHGMTTGNWYHFAIVRNGDRYDFYLNGISINHSTIATTYPNYSGAFNIGNNYNGGANECIAARFDAFRISNTARWTENFSGSLPDSESYYETTSKTGPFPTHFNV